MTEKIQAMTIILMTSILFTGGVVPYSFDTYGDDSGDDSYGDDSHGDECGCDKPSIFTVEYNGPAADKIEIFKKKNDFNNNVVAHTFTVDDLGNSINSGSKITINSDEDLGKRKMSSNTFYKVTSNGQEAKFVIHTSCSKPLFVGQVHDQKESSDFDATLTVIGGYDLEWDDTMYADFSCDIRDQQDDLFECDGTLINFDNNVETPHGTLLEQINLSTEFSDIGVQLANPPGEGGPHSTTVIYDSTPGSGADGDLEVNIGNLAIIPDNLGNPPNFEELSDSANGGEQVYTFSPPKNIRSFVWVDQDSSSETIHVTARDSGGNLIHEIPTIDPPVGNKNAKRVMFAADNTSELTFDYSGSGGITNICITDPPIPDKGTIVVNKFVEGTVPEDAFNFEYENSTHTVPFLLNDEDSETFDDLIPGDYFVRELAHAGYSLDIQCPGAEEIIGDEVKIIIVEGETVTCDFTNTEIIPTTITLKKALTNDNGGTRTAESFGVNIDNGLPVMLGMPTDITPGVSHFINETQFEDYSFVLIAGDTSCPSMLEESFTLNEGEQITCTIYNDDNFVEGGSSGIFFHRLSMPINIPGPVGSTNACSVPFPVPVPAGDLPCVQEEIPNNSYLVHDANLGSDTAAVLVTITPTAGGAFGVCELSGILDADTFKFTCNGAPAGDYNVNYALIETPTIAP